MITRRKEARYAAAAQAACSPIAFAMWATTMDIFSIARRPQFAHDPDVIANPRIAIAGVTPEAASVYLSCTKGLPNVVRRSRPVAGGASGDCSEFSYVHPRLTRTC